MSAIAGNTGSPVASRSLNDLAREINDAHASADAAFRDAVRHAIRAGDLLLQAKGQVTHGESNNFSASVRTAQGYMRLARQREDAQRVAHLGVGAALRALSSDRPLRPSMLDELVGELRLEEEAPAFVRCARALLEIRDRALFRQTHTSWPAYLENRWGLNRLEADLILGEAEGWL